MTLIETLIEKAKLSPKRVALPECEAEKTLLAARRVKDEGIGIPVLVGDPEVIRATAQTAGVPVDDMEVVNILDEVYRDDVIAKYMEYPEISEAIKALEEKFAGEGRVLIRPSGTEPLVRVMIEGKDQKVITEEAQKLATLIQDVMF